MFELLLPIAIELGHKYDVDPYLILAVAKVESNYNPKAVGKSHGEIGLMQLRPTYFPKASFDIYSNLEEGTKHLAKKISSCKHLQEAAFICYNVGSAGGRKIKRPKQFPYYLKVMAAYGEISRDRRNIAQRKSTPGYATLSQSIGSQ